MEVKFTPRDTSVLYRLLAEDTTDIILKTDREGYILHASPGIRRLGLPLTGQLIGKRVVGLARTLGLTTDDVQSMVSRAGLEVLR